MLEEDEENLASVDTLERSSDWWGIDRYYEVSSDEEDDLGVRANSHRAASTSGRTVEKKPKQVRLLKLGVL